MGYKTLSNGVRVAAGVSSLAANYYGLGGSSTETVTTMRNTNAVPVEIGELTRLKRTAGRRRRRTVRNAHRLAGACLDAVYLRCTGSNPYCTSAAGFVKFANNYDSRVNYPLGTPAYVYPIKIFNLSGVGQPANQATTCPTIGYQPVLTSQTVSTSGIQMQPITLPGPQAQANQANFIVESSDNTAFLSGKALYNWNDIRILAYGTKNLPTEWCIEIVTFPDYEFSPGYIADVANATSYAPQVVRFWEWMAQRYIRSTVDIPGANEEFKKKVHVVHRTCFTLQAETTIEGSATVPHMKDIKIFHKLDKLYRHKYDPSGYQMANVEGGNTWEQDIQQSQLYIFPRYEQRYYLILRAQCGRTNIDGAPVWDVNTCPSFDITIRRKYQTNGQ